MKFIPEHKVINDLFGNDIKYIIPEYQRPYSWDCLGKSDKNNQVNVMWDDLMAFFNQPNNDTYFLGTMVLITTKGNDREFQVVDGQQRLTTLVLLFVAIKCFLTKQKEAITEATLKNFIDETILEVDNLMYNKIKFGALTVDKKVRIERSMGFDYDAILKSTMECATTPPISTTLTDEQSIIVNRYFNNRLFFEEQLSKTFLDDTGNFTIDTAKLLNHFFEILKNKISIVRLLTEDFNVAYHIFEILNNRGLPLSNKDLFRNFIIEQFSSLKKNDTINRYADIEPSKKWNELENELSITDDFIGRFVESRKAAQQRYSAFNDVQQLLYADYQGNIKKKKIEVFFDDCKRDLIYYNYIVNPDLITDKKIANKILFLINSGNARYSINLILALFRHLDYQGNANQNALDFIVYYERYLLSILLIPTKRFSNAPIYKAISALNAGNLAEAMSVINLSEKEITQLKAAINADIKDNDTAKLLIAKYVWVIETKTDDDVMSQTLDYSKATLEHIIPQKPDTNTNWLTHFNPKFRDLFTYRLGNMTLLTHTLNASARNFDYEEKRKRYAKTKLFITAELPEIITTTFIENRQHKIVHTLLEDLDL